MSGRLYEFLSFLDRRRIYYRLNRARHDSVEVNITIFGRRIEVSFLDDDTVEYSIFEGDENVFSDFEGLMTLLSRDIEPSRTRNFTYDALERLTKVEEPRPAPQPAAVTESYTLDAEGNRINSHASAYHVTVFEVGGATIEAVLLDRSRLRPITRK
jgi:hypothetical protein